MAQRINFQCSYAYIAIFTTLRNPHRLRYSLYPRNNPHPTGRDVNGNDGTRRKLTRQLKRILQSVSTEQVTMVSKRGTRKCPCPALSAVLRQAGPLPKTQLGTSLEQEVEALWTSASPVQGQKEVTFPSSTISMGVKHRLFSNSGIIRLFSF